MTRHGMHWRQAIPMRRLIAFSGGGPWQVVAVKTHVAVMKAVLRHTQAAVEEVAWLVTSMRTGTVAHVCSISRGALDTAVCPPTTALCPRACLVGAICRTPARLTNEGCARRERQAFVRIEMIAKVVDKLVKVVPEGALEEAALKLIVHLYQLLTAATRSCIAPKGVKQVCESGNISGSLRHLTRGPRGTVAEPSAHACAPNATTHINELVVLRMTWLEDDRCGRYVRV
jgi:hypothetical protein